MDQNRDLYLSRLLHDPRGREVRRDLADLHALHRRVMTAFPDLGAADARARFGVLHRLDVHPRTGALTLLVQAAVTPDWSRLPVGYLLATGGDPPNPATKPVADAYAALRAGQALTFRLRANPTRRLATPPAADGRRPPGKRVDLRHEVDQLEWLARKGGAGGFEPLTVRTAAAVPNVRVAPEGTRDGRRRERAAAPGSTPHRLSFGSVLFEGELRVVDAERFRQTLMAGIGSGKAYGFGLLSIAPAGGGQ